MPESRVLAHLQPQPPQINNRLRGCDSQDLYTKALTNVTEWQSDPKMVRLFGPSVIFNRSVAVFLWASAGGRERFLSLARDSAVHQLFRTRYLVTSRQHLASSWVQQIETFFTTSGFRMGNYASFLKTYLEVSLCQEW